MDQEIYDIWLEGWTKQRIERGRQFARLLGIPNRQTVSYRGGLMSLQMAAPNLYAELLCARHTLVFLCDTPEDSPCIKRIDSVLAKARG